MIFRFQDGGNELTHTETTCLVEKAEAVVSARPAGEVIPNASIRTPQGTPYRVSLEALYFSLSNELNDPAFTREVGLVALNGMKEWLKTIKTRNLRLSAVLIVKSGSPRPLGVLGFSTLPRFEQAVVQ